LEGKVEEVLEKVEEALGFLLQQLSGFRLAQNLKMR